MLDVIDSAQAQIQRRTPNPHEPPGPGQELPLGGIPAVDVDIECGTLIALGAESGGTPGGAGVTANEAAHRHAKLFEERAGLGHRGGDIEGAEPEGRQSANGDSESGTTDRPERHQVGIENLSQCAKEGRHPHRRPPGHGEDPNHQIDGGESSGHQR